MAFPATRMRRLRRTLNDARLLPATCYHAELRRTLDWRRLLRRFKTHERVLMAHLMLFGYAYPSERGRVPEWVMGELEQAIRNEGARPQRLCFGTNMAQKGYGVPIREWGFADGRLKPHGPLTPQEVGQLPPP